MTLTQEVSSSNLKLPNGWRWVRLGEVCEFTYGESLPARVRQEGRVPVYGSNGVVDFHAEAVTSGPTIIIGRKGSIGEIHFSTGPCWPIDTTYYIERPKVECDLEWLSHWLRAIALTQLNKAAAVPGLNREDAYAIEIPLPPLSEQKRIAAILAEEMAAVKRARVAAEAQLEAAKTLPAAYLRQVFESEGAKSWPRKRLGELCELVNGDAYRESDWSSKGIPIIRIQNLNDPAKPFNYWAGPLEDRVLVNAGNVLIAWSGTPGTSFGAHLWTREPGVLNQHIFRVDLDLVHVYPEWAVIAIDEQLSVMIGKAHGGVGLRHVTKREVQALNLALPPLAVQRRISAHLSERMAGVEKVENAVEEQLDAINKLPAALLRRAFNGEL